MSLAIQIRQNGGPEELQLVEVQVGDPAAGEIRVRHHAIGLNFIDVYQRTGLYPFPMPLQLGMEAAGVVEAVGEGVTHLNVGDRVAYASNPPGSYSTERVMPARCVCRLPEAISFETGAAMMLKGLTAQYLLKKTLPVQGLQRGDAVLFHAAAGGVGLIACQWARALGLELIATAGSDAKCQLALANGAAHAINYSTEDFAARVKEITQGQGVKVVYDSVGKDTAVCAGVTGRARLALCDAPDLVYPHCHAREYAGHGGRTVRGRREWAGQDSYCTALCAARCAAGAPRSGSTQDHGVNDSDGGLRRFCKPAWAWASRSARVWRQAAPHACPLAGLGARGKFPAG